LNKARLKELVFLINQNKTRHSRTAVISLRSSKIAEQNRKRLFLLVYRFPPDVFLA